MQLHHLKRATAHRQKKYIGRGGKRGTTSGRGTKGQKARAGHKIRPEIRDIIKKLPKQRGYRFSSFAVKALPVNLGKIDQAYLAGEAVSPETLLAKKIIRRMRGAIPAVKILADGSLTKALTFSACLVSATARGKIEKAGGKITA